MPSLTRTNIHIYPSNMIRDSRILKISQSLIDANFFDRIELLGTEDPNLPEMELVRNNVVIRRLKVAVFGRLSNYRIINILIWSIRVFLYCLKKDIFCINCHTLTVLPICVLLRLIKGCKLVYDTHELETEKNGVLKIRRFLSKTVENSLITFCDLIITVNESICDHYKRSYPQVSARIMFVRNIPAFSTLPTKSDYLRITLGIQDKLPIFIYQGVIGHGRSVKKLLEVFLNFKGVAHLVFMGYGPLVELVKQSQNNYIHYHEAVKPADILPITASADAGICLIENTSLSYYLCLPNKFFEYISAGIPILASNFPELERIVFGNGIGEVCDPEDNIGITKKILEMCSRNYSLNLETVRKALSWSQEAERMKQFYNKYILS